MTDIATISALPSACSVTVQDAVVHAAYNSDEDAQAAFEIIGGSRVVPAAEAAFRKGIAMTAKEELAALTEAGAGEAVPDGVKGTAQYIADALGVTPLSDIRPYIVRAVELAHKHLVSARPARILSALTAPPFPQNHSVVDGPELGICARCGKPSADAIHQPVFPGDYTPPSPAPEVTTIPTAEEAQAKLREIVERNPEDFAEPYPEAALQSAEQPDEGDSEETIDRNPKSWIAWKREAARLRAEIEKNTDGLWYKRQVALSMENDRLRQKVKALEADRLADLRRLMTALGMNTDARSQSPASVFDECLRKIEGMRP